MAKPGRVKLGWVKLLGIVTTKVELELQLRLVLIYFVHLVAFSYVSYISYTRPFLVVSCSSSDTQKTSQECRF